MSGSETTREGAVEKPRIELIPPEVIFAMAEVLTFGAGEHGERDWENGKSWSKVFGSLMRHLWAWWRGEDKDPQSGRSHLWHAAARIAFLIAYEQRRNGTDDRPSRARLGLRHDT
ncbi:dATP/dGTP diphosphohydrolase domain-containing protein [Rhizobium sp. LC145]|uniref:dATP/dGTP diphosphohydrolase domain-containing protein n=1 Tax=Rhizobium sp. LC145 TaxID=1120688 RepID=UPI00062A2659|nr:dATP/dGTP diphosphohydrolase domain-containing protein [Rhizobium sp. LC145]KKX28242.1 hypothetical protein YH62_19330 [Rhizobium sp. LC145]TKT58340.1 hypothetical protein FDR95_12085 [Rhizobiaceae bacterium LC148]